MILTVTLNVAVDKSYVLDQPIHVGDVMRVKTCCNTAGGKGLNVSKVIKQCGEDVLATGFTGGFNGAYVEHMLREKGVESRFVHVAAETRSCINILASDGTTTEFLERGLPVTKEETQRFLEEFQNLLPGCEAVVMSGTAPQGVPADIYARLVMLAKEAGVKPLLDTSGAFLSEGCKAAPWLIKPNEEEISQLLGREVGSEEELIRAAQDLCRSGIAFVVISLGAEGSLTVCGDGVFRAVAPDVPVVNTVGCGDSMMGAMAVAAVGGMGVEDMLRYATAVSAANAMNLETGYFRQEDFQAVLPQVRVKRVG